MYREKYKFEINETCIRRLLAEIAATSHQAPSAAIQMTTAPSDFVQEMWQIDSMFIRASIVPTGGGRVN